MQLTSIPLRILTAITIYLCAHSLGAQQSTVTVRDQVRTYRLTHEKEILGEFARLLSVPNLASDTPNIERNARTVAAMLKSRGVDVKLLGVPGSPPVVYGIITAPGSHPTVGIYAHYDGQPAEADQWQSPPFSPVLRDVDGHPLNPQSEAHYPDEARIYARSAGDDKAPIQAVLSALDALSAS